MPIISLTTTHKRHLDLLDQKTPALVSDGGAPVSDPGFYLSRACIDKGLFEALLAYSFCAGTHVIGSSYESICL